MTQTTVQEWKTGQLITTLPKQIASALRISGKDKLEWIFDKGDLIVRKV